MEQRAVVLAYDVCGRGAATASKGNYSCRLALFCCNFQLSGPDHCHLIFGCCPTSNSPLTTKLFTLLIRSIACLLATCHNHLNLYALVLSLNLTILSTLLAPNFHRIISFGCYTHIYTHLLSSQLEFACHMQYPGPVLPLRQAGSRPRVLSCEGQSLRKLVVL